MTVKFNAAAFRERTKRAVMRGIIRGTESVRTEAISLMQNGPKTGRIYRRGGVEHQASAPGEAPAVNIGTLIGSIATEYNFKTLSGRVIARAPYGAYLEYGTERMEPRPFLRPALAAKRQDTADFIQEELDKEFK